MIASIIGLVSIPIWLLIPFRQRGTDYFYYFLVYAISSGLLLVNRIFLIHPAYFYLGQGFFLIISLYNFKDVPRYKILLLIFLILSIALPFILSIKTIIVSLIVTHIIIFCIILKRTILYVGKQEKINIFYFVILLYEITIITRLIVVLKDIMPGMIFFYITTAFGILIGIFFLFYNEVNSPILNLGTKEIT